MNENDIKQILDKYNIGFAQHSTIWGKVIPSVGAYNNGIGEIMHIMREHILHFNNEGVAILAVDDMTGKIQENTLTFIPNKNIDSINIKVNRFSFMITVRTKNGDITYKAKKNILGSRWHKENLSFLLLRTSLK